MMKSRLRSGLLFLLTLTLLLGLSLPLSSQTDFYPDAPLRVPLSALQFNPQRLQALLDENDLAGAIEHMEVGWKNQFDEYYRGFLRSELLSAEQIAESLRQNASTTGNPSALVYVVALPGQLEVVLLPPQGPLLHHRVTAAPRETVIEISNTLRAGLVNVEAPLEEFLPAAQQLYEWIIAPLATVLERQNIETLIFCLGQGLRSVPMAALHDGDRFLIENYSVDIIPAYNLLDRHPARLDGVRVLAMGASEFQDKAPLPAVPVELEAIAQLWQGEVWLNQDFTLSKLRERRRSQPFGLVHFATHATFAPGSIRDSYIQFWDQPLRLSSLHDINLRLPIVQLLVLSACRTALGDPNAELGFAGLAVQSGAKAVLASLWSVSDAATVVMMVDFYQNLKTQPTKAEALRQTQLDMLQGQLHIESSSVQQVLRDIPQASTLADSLNTNLSHPYYWSGFTLIGNPW
jgi:CHAT domain-containing protein